MDLDSIRNHFIGVSIIPIKWQSNYQNEMNASFCGHNRNTGLFPPWGHGDADAYRAEHNPGCMFHGHPGFLRSLYENGSGPRVHSEGDRTDVSPMRSFLSPIVLTQILPAWHITSFHPRSWNQYRRLVCAYNIMEGDPILPIGFGGCGRGYFRNTHWEWQKKSSGKRLTENIW